MPSRGLGRDAILLLGVEPSLRWRRFSSIVVDLAKEYEVEMVVTLGALLADVPHTRPAPVTGTASDPDLVEQLGLQASRYEGPTGSSASSTTRAGRRRFRRSACGRPCRITCRSRPVPRRARALQRLGDLLDTQIDTAELEQAVDAYTQRVTEAVSTDEETAEYVQELERRSEMIDETTLPSGDSLRPS